MATTNNLDSNISKIVLREFTKGFDDGLVITKLLNTTTLRGKFAPNTGDTIYVKRATDYTTARTPDGDLTAVAANPIVVGNAPASTQPYFSTLIETSSAEESLKLDQLPELIRPMGMRMAKDYELSIFNLMKNNTNLLAGSVGTPVTKWDHVAEAGAVMKSTGVPDDGLWNYFVNPYTQRKLASDQRSLGAVDPLVREAHQRAMIADNFAGMRVYSTSALSSHTTGAGADRVGTLAANPIVTYVAAKDTFQQVLSVSGFQANLEIKAGETLIISGRNRISQAFRGAAFLDDAGNPVPFSGTVVSDVTLDGTGAGLVTISGMAVFEANGQYNTVDSAPVAGDIITLAGAASSIIQPNIFCHRDAFAIGSVVQNKLDATDFISKSEQGLILRITKDSQFLKNNNLMRVDFWPTFSILNPFFAGQSFGRP